MSENSSRTILIQRELLHRIINMLPALLIVFKPTTRDKRYDFAKCNLKKVVPIIAVLISNFVGSSYCAKNVSRQFIGESRLYLDLKSLTTSDVYKRGSFGYFDRKLTQNGLCSNIFPDFIVLPKSTRDVSTIIKLSRKYDVPISIKSGGHSYICSNIKDRGIHVDLRGLNKIELTTRFPFNPPGPALLLGPGQTWGQVLSIIPKERYTFIHGACLSVGVGGYLIGGGAQASGTTQRFGFGNFNVLQFTMVDAAGNIVKVKQKS